MLLRIYKIYVRRQRLHRYQLGWKSKMLTSPFNCVSGFSKMWTSEGTNQPQPSTFTTKEQKWIYHGIPFRPTIGIYDIFNGSDLPPIDASVLAKFKHVRNCEDMKAHSRELETILNSTTACYIDIGEDHTARLGIVFLVFRTGGQRYRRKDYLAQTAKPLKWNT